MSIVDILNKHLESSGVLTTGSYTYQPPGFYEKNLKQIRRTWREELFVSSREMGAHGAAHHIACDEPREKPLKFLLSEAEAATIRAKVHFHKIRAIRLYSCPTCWPDYSPKNLNIRIEDVFVVEELLKEFLPFLIVSDYPNIRGIPPRIDEIEFYIGSVGMDDWPRYVNPLIMKKLKERNMVVPKDERDRYCRNEIFRAEIKPITREEKEGYKHLLLDYLNSGREPIDFVKRVEEYINIKEGRY